MMHPSTMKLVDRLCAMTAQGKIDWTHGEAPESLVYDTEGYSVILHGTPTNIKLTDSSGVELESVSASDLSQTALADGGTYEGAVATLVVDAQRVARGTETAINTVLQGLDLDGDGVVDIPMEDGLVPTAAEITDPEPDMIEDTADESGVASLADADVTDVSNAVASLADEVNQTETEQLAASQTEEILEAVEETVQIEPLPENETSATPIQAAGLGMAGLGAAGLLKAARPAERQAGSETASTELDIPQALDDIPDAIAATDLPDVADLAEPVMPTDTSFSLTAADASETPLQLSSEQQALDAKETPEADSEDVFSPPKPGQVLSLSGLTNGASKDTPIMAGTATSMLGADHPSIPQTSASDTPTPEPDETTAVPAVSAPDTPDLGIEDETPDVEAAAEPETDAEPDAEPVKETPRPSRFNPWI